MFPKTQNSLDTVALTNWSPKCDWSSFVSSRILQVSVCALITSPVLAQGFPPEIELSSLPGGDGSLGFALYGESEFDNVGVTVRFIEDINGDSLDELVVGARLAENGDVEDAGAVYVVFGQDGGGFPAEFDLATLANGDGSQGFVMRGTGFRDLLGKSISDADVNGDGISDLLVGTDLSRSTTLGGSTYVVFGRKAGGFPAMLDPESLVTGNGNVGFVIEGASDFDVSGRGLGTGDINGDGTTDLVIGARGGAPRGVTNAGEAFVVYGQIFISGTTSSVFDLSTISDGDGSQGFVLEGRDSFDEIGHSISTGDIDGDGIDDLVIGAPRADLDGSNDQSGSIYVLFGRSSASGGFPPTVLLTTLAEGDGSDGFILTGTEPSDRAGASVDVGDINGDGIDDVIVGATGAAGNRPESGRTYVMYGQRSASGAFQPVIPLLSLVNDDGSTGFVLNGEDGTDHSGLEVAAADVDGDGIEDVLIGAERGNPDGPGNGRGDAGKNYIVYGRQADAGGFPAEFDLGSIPAGDGSQGFVVYGITSNDGKVSGTGGLGLSAGTGDLNGDGITDLAVGRPGVDRDDQLQVGAAYVIFGQPSGMPSTAVLGLNNSPAAVEGDYLQFLVQLSEPVYENVSFDVTTIDGTAIAPEDYDSKGGTRLLAPGETEKIIWVPTHDDSAAEENEILRLKLSNPINAELGKVSAKGTIVDNDDPSDWARLTISNARAAEGGRAIFELSLSKPANEDVKVGLQTIDVTATAIQDYAPKGGVRTIPAGETSGKIFVDIAEDDIVEGVEKFRLRIEARSNNVVVEKGEATATGTITGP